MALKLRTLFRPKRLAYMRGKTKTEHCVFCESASEGLTDDSLLIYRDELSIIVLNKFPYNTAHCLVLPHRHEGDLSALSKAESADLHEKIRCTVQALTNIYQPQGFNVGLNLGKAAGAGLPEHLHYHVIPRWAGDLNFFPLIAESKIVPEELSETLSKLRQEVSKLISNYSAK